MFRYKNTRNNKKYRIILHIHCVVFSSSTRILPANSYFGLLIFLCMADLLRSNIEEFIKITDEDFLEISQLFEQRDYRKGDFIIRVDEPVYNIYFIQSGLVKLSYWDQDGREHIASFAMENWWETDFDAFYHNGRSSSIIQCLEATTAYLLSFKNYQHLCLQFPYMTGYFLDKSIRGHISNQNRIRSLLTLAPKEQYEQFLRLYPTLVQRIPKTILAAYLGVSRETLSRIYRSRK